MTDILKALAFKKEDEPKQVVRLTTNAYQCDGKFVVQKTLRTLKRLSHGHQVLDEDCSMVGASEVLERILNLNKVEDGLYLVHMTNVQTDWETGHVDSWDYELIPYISPSS